MAAKETKTEAVVTEKPTTRGATSGEAAAPEITQEMIARAPTTSPNPEKAGPTRRTGTRPRRSCGRARSASTAGSSRRPIH